MAISEGMTKNLAKRAFRTTDEGIQEVEAITEEEIEHASASGDAYSWRSADTDINAGDTRLFIKNTGDRFLKFDRADFGPANVVCKWDIGIGALTTTATGTTITANNLNETFKTKTPDYVAWDDETAVADATPCMTITTSTVDSKEISLKGLILGKNHYIQINQETESTSGQVTVFGHFVDELV